mgnify:CR=1 FL=1
MAADPKDTTVTEENTETAAEAAAEVETVASAPTSPAQKLSAEALIKAFENEQMKSDLPEIYVGDTCTNYCNFFNFGHYLCFTSFNFFLVSSAVIIDAPRSVTILIAFSTN